MRKCDRSTSGYWIIPSLIATLVIVIVLIPTAVVLSKDGRGPTDRLGSPMPNSELSETPTVLVVKHTPGTPMSLNPHSPSNQPTIYPSVSPPSNSPSASPSTSPSTNNPTQNPTYKPWESMLLAYYYPWYIRDDWSRHGYQDEPLLGKYGTDEPAIAEQHIEWAERAGIDAWVVSYNTDTSLTARHFEAGMLQASNIDKIKFCMLYESLMALPTLNFADGTIALDAVISAVIHMRDTYFDHPSYLKINDRPVVVLYVTRNWQNFEPYMLDLIKDAIGIDVFFIADEPFYGWQRTVDGAWNGVQDGKPVFEAYTTYNMFTDPTVRDGESAKDFMFREALPIFEHWSENTVFFPNVLPMYHDFRGNPTLVGDAAGFREQLDTFACLPRPSWYEGEFPNLIFVTSWNEWWEGSQVEPDDSEKYGFTFLDELRRFKDTGIQCAKK